VFAARTYPFPNVCIQRDCYKYPFKSLRHKFYFNQCLMVFICTVSVFWTLQYPEETRSSGNKFNLANSTFYIKLMPIQLFMTLYTTVADLDPLQLQIRWNKNLNSSGLVNFLKRFLLIQATYYVLLPD
jgi:hypothetical protein